MPAAPEFPDENNRAVQCGAGVLRPSICFRPFQWVDPRRRRHTSTGRSGAHRLASGARSPRRAGEAGSGANKRRRHRARVNRQMRCDLCATDPSRRRASGSFHRRASRPARAPGRHFVLKATWRPCGDYCVVLGRSRSVYLMSARPILRFSSRRPGRTGAAGGTDLRVRHSSGRSGLRKRRS